MITHITGLTEALEPVPDDENHWGSAQSSYRTIYSTADQMAEVGLWEFVGEQRTTDQDGYEEVLVCISGSAEITCDGQTYAIGTGDVLVYDCPIGPKQIHSTDGFRAAYVVRHRAAAGS